jgi:hypothetical protein
MARAVVSLEIIKLLVGEIRRGTGRLQTGSPSGQRAAADRVKRRSLFVEAAALDQFTFLLHVRRKRESARYISGVDAPSFHRLGTLDGMVG